MKMSTSFCSRGVIWLITKRTVGQIDHGCKEFYEGVKLKKWEDLFEAILNMLDIYPFLPLSSNFFTLHLFNPVAKKTILRQTKYCPHPSTLLLCSVVYSLCR